MAPISRSKDKPGQKIAYRAAVLPNTPRKVKAGKGTLVRGRHDTNRRSRTGLASHVVKRPRTPPVKPVDLRRDCVICASSKDPRAYKPSKGTSICSHFHDICKSCVEKLIYTKIANHDLESGDLACPFPDCEHVLSYSSVRKMVSTGVFER